jgi:hypothetical protein
MAKTGKLKGSSGESLEPLEPLKFGLLKDVFNEHQSRERAKEIAAAEHAAKADKIRSAKRAAAAIYKRRAQEAGKPLFDETKREALRAILLKAGASNEAAKVLVRETEFARALMPIEEELKSSEVVKRLKKFVESAVACARAWSELGDDLRFSFNETDLGADFYAVRFCAEELIKDIGSPTGLHSNSDYRYIHTIAEFWKRAGLNTSFSGNDSGATKAKALFEQYVCESLAPMIISNWAIREVAGLFSAAGVVGEKKARGKKISAP